MNTVISPVKVDERKSLDLRVGDTVRVHQKIVEKGKTRTQVFEGLVLARKHGSEAGATFTVRKVASGVGMEKVFPLYSPNISKIEVKSRGKTRRAKLYYIREKAAKEAARKIRQIRSELTTVADETVVEPQEVKEEVSEATTDAAPEAAETPKEETEATPEASAETEEPKEEPKTDVA